MKKAGLYLFIGGPGTGKSTTLEALKRKGFTCFDEVSREVTLAAQKEGISQLFLEKPLLFSEKLLEGRISQFKKAKKHNGICFIDRGIPDVTAYMDFFNQSYPAYFLEANHKFTYDKVFHFPTWPEIYKQDNERYESIEQAKKIDKQLVKTYESLGYEVIKVPKASIDKRVKFIQKSVDAA